MDDKGSGTVAGPESSDSAAISIVQVVFWCGLYATTVEDKLEQFTDVCSLANISVFAMAQKNFGYYIHGK